MGIDVINKEVFFSEEHQRLLDTSCVQLPWIDEVHFKDNKLKVYSLFKRRKAKRNQNIGDGNPLIYALKKQKGYTVACKEVERMMPFFEHNLDVCIKSIEFNCIIASPSSHGLVVFLVKKILSKTAGVVSYKRVFNKVTNGAVIQQINGILLESNLTGKDKRYYTSLLNKLKQFPNNYFSMKEVSPKYRNGIEVYSFNEKFNSEALRGKNILIVDDLLATGTSLLSVNRLLSQSGANSVVGLCIFGAL